MKLSRILLLATTLAALSLPTFADDWFFFQDPDSVYSVRFPVKPSRSHDTQSLADGTGIVTTTYTDDLGSLSLMVAVTDRRDHPVDPESAVGNAVAALKNMASQVWADQASPLDRRIGREVILTTKDGNHLDERIYFTESRLYQVIAVTTVNASPDQILGSKQFLESFHFVAK
ncbi:MAG: hypothetical protein ABSD74_19015 [Rhizomicrobium sp.]|jgi:hypothetical protein